MITGHDSRQKVLITAWGRRGAANLHLIWRGIGEQIEKPPLQKDDTGLGGGKVFIIEYRKLWKGVLFP